MRRSFYLLVLMMFVSACAPQEEENQEGFQLRNPKTADVQIQNNIVTIDIPASDPYFRLEKIKDDSGPYEVISFKYDGFNKTFLYKTDLDDWQPLPAGEDSIQMGQILIEFEGKDVTITYPSGTWAFP